MVAFCIHQGKNSCLPTLSMTERFQRSLYWEYFLPQLLGNGSFPILVASSLFSRLFTVTCFFVHVWNHRKYFPMLYGATENIFLVLVAYYLVPVNSISYLYPNIFTIRYFLPESIKNILLKNFFKKLSCRLKISRLSCWLNALNHNVYIDSFLS